MKEKFSIGKVNGTEIFAVKTDQGDVLVPVKPICTALGVDVEGQRKKIMDDEILNSVADFCSATGSDGKSYEMLCLPEEFIYGWIFTINPKNVVASARESVREFRRLCYTTLYDYFHGRAQRTQEVIDIERGLMKERKELDETLSGLMKTAADVKSRVKSIDSQLDKLQAERLNPQRSLFD